MELDVSSAVRLYTQRPVPLLRQPDEIPGAALDPVPVRHRAVLTGGFIKEGKGPCPYNFLQRISKCSDVTQLTPQGWKKHSQAEMKAKRSQILEFLHDST